MKTRLLILLVLGFFFHSCSDNGGGSDIVQINYGTSFGECGGYCIYTAEFTNDSYESEKSSWIQEEEFPTTNCKLENPMDWSELAGLASFDEFKTLDEIIGCPDCTDGGAEFIEIVTGDESYKVTFEFGTPPNEVTNLQEKIRELVSQESDWECE